MEGHEEALQTMWAEHRAAMASGPLPSFAEAFVLRPTAVEPYEDVLRLAGVPLSPSFAAALRVGTLDLPLLRAVGLGVELDTPQRIFDNHLHALAERSAGVSQGGAWLVFATEHGDLEPAYAFDRRYVSADGEVEIGHYHQDIVCHEPVADDGHLPLHAESYRSWFAAQLANYRHALEHELGREAIAKKIEWARETRIPSRPRTWQEIWASYGDFSGWPKRYWSAYRTVLRETTDPSVAEAIAARVDRELIGKGERVVPGLSSDLERGWWTTGLPGPGDLATRLPTAGDAGQLALLRFVLRHCGVDPRSEATRAAWAQLERRIAGDEDAAASVRHRCADEGWAFALGEPETPQHQFAQALGWALGPLDRARILHVLSLAHGIRTRVAGDRKLALHRVWSRLRRIQRGESVPEHLVAPKPVLDPIVAELAQWLSTFDGPQRAQLAAFEQDWMPRLRGLSSAQLEQVKTKVRKRIKSKKLAQARDALLDSLG